jgi:hypothetical protein
MTELMKIGVLKPDDNSKREVAAHRNETKKSLPSPTILINPASL